MGGLKVCTMDKGRPELLRFLPLGILETGESTGDEEGRFGKACVTGDEGADLEDCWIDERCGFDARNGFGSSWGGEEVGVGVLDSLPSPENWDMNERTAIYSGIRQH